MSYAVGSGTAVPSQTSRSEWTFRWWNSGRRRMRSKGAWTSCFRPLYRPRKCIFCLECKRLNVVKGARKRSYATEYVVHGMMRFMTGLYASRVQEGGMLGYVLDGNVRDAINRVSTVVGSRWQELGMESPGLLLGSTMLATVATARETRHRRGTAEEPFVIHHLFVPA